MKKIITIIVFAFLIFSCNEAKKEKSIEKPAIEKEIAANYESIEVEIEGMTCEIGCARTIQSKISKVKGVSYAKVDFESKKGQFTFDSNIISKDEIVKKIDGIAGGDLYSVTKTVTLEEVIESAE